MNKTKRLFSFIQTLNQYPAISAQELAKKHQISERSVYRYLNELKSIGFSLHQLDGQESLERRHALSPLTFTAIEALSLVAACQSLLSQKGLPYCEPLETSLQKVIGALSSVEDKRSFRRLETRFTYLSNTLRDHDPWQEIIHTINDSIRKNRTIAAVYDSASANQTTERCLDPYHIFFRDGNLYLAAFCHKRKMVCSFRIDRFKNIKLTQSEFTKEPSFNIDDYLGTSWGVWRGDKEISISFLVHPPASRIFRESTFHASQQIQELDDGKILCNITTYHTPEIITWLLGWGSQIRVLEPPELVNEIKRELKSAYEDYGSGTLEG